MITPVSTSPVPAVASAAVPESQTSGCLTRRSDERVGPFEQNDATVAFDCLCERLEPVLADPLRLRADQARELPGVRRQHAGRGPRRGLELVERVRVNHRRHLELGEQAPYE